MHNYGHWKKTLALLVMSALSLGASSVDAMPEGGVIRSGEGAVSQNGREMTIRQDSGRLAMDWTNFNVGKDETVRFQQPGKDALALNRVTGNQQSVIDGSLLSNGHVLLVNPNGVVIGKNASINVGGLVASTAHVKDNFMKEFGNSTGAFTLGGVSDGKIINEGTINAEGGLVALHAAKVENSGIIKSNGGSVLMAAADTLTLTPDTDGKLNFTVDGKVAEASALNKGVITADGGTIVMTADSASDVMSTVVNNEGTLQARTLRKNEKGQILLEGNDKGQVEVSGTLDASGTDDGQDAGNIKVIGQKTIVHDGTNLLARGDVSGGKIETSGDVLDLGDNLNIDAKGVNGKAGEWLLDPLDVIIADKAKDPTGTDSYSIAEKKTAGDSDFTNGSASIDYNDPEATTANAASVNSAVTWIYTETVENMLNNGTNVTIQAVATNGNANIIVKNDIDKTAGGDATFTLDAMRNITVDGNITSKVGKLKVVLNADSDGDKIGAVIINKDIKTNGGDFISASGGTAKYSSDKNNTKGYGKGTLTGSADPVGHSVGTYFGHVDESGTADGEKDDRLIQTNGGKITLNGEVAIGLNGGTLTLDSNGGEVNVTGIINSGNSYGAYVYGTTTWDTLTAGKVAEYLKSGEVPAYHYQFVNYKKDANGNYVTDENGNYVLDETINEDGTITYNKQSFTGRHYNIDSIDTQNVRFAADGTNGALSNTCVTQAGDGYSSVIVTKGTMSFAQWLQYEFQDTKVEFAKKYIPQSSGFTIKVGTDTKGNTTQTVVNSSGNAVSDAVLREYLKTAQQNEKLATDETIMINGKSAKENITDDIKRLLASNWFEAKELAQINDGQSTNGGSAVGDSYLATITTILENSLTTPNGQQILWAGGMGSGVLHKTGDSNNPYAYYGLPDDPTHSNGMYWVTGPEGEANNRKGTQFYSNVGSNWANKKYGETVYGYANWDTYKENNGTVTRYQPDNSSPFLTVGYGTTGKWDDAAMGGSTTVGFIKEINLANSSLNIKAGSGDVKLQGDIGKAKALDTVSINSDKTVTIGDTSNKATEYNHGTVYVDHGLYISGNGVTVGGEIHSGESEETDTSTTLEDTYKDNVTILSSGNIEVHGITSNTYASNDGTTTTRGGKISLTSTGDSGKITLGAGVDYDGNATAGTIAAGSSDNGAVIIDAQGKTGAFINSTDPKSPAITTAPHGTWQVYVASPSDYGTVLGGNLNSETNAQWSSESTKKSTSDESDKNAAGKDIGTYTDHTQNKFIFQVTPVITISGGNQKKTYGDTLPKDQLRGLLSTSATYTDSTGKDVDVTQFSNFNEADYLTYVTSSDGTKTGTDAVAVSSGGADAKATRTDGNEKNPGTNDYKTASDRNRAFYVFNVEENGAKALNGYDLKTVNGDIEILRKTLTISTDGTQTYGNTAVTNGTPSYDKTQLVNGDTLGDIQYTIATDGSYADSKGSNDTAHVGSYDKQYLTSSAEIKASDGSDASANYEVTGSGTITVNPADLYLTVGNVFTTYGTAFDTDKYTYTIDKEKGGLVNGDTQSVLGDKFLNYTNTGDATDPVKIANGALSQNAGTYELQGVASKDLSDYTVHITNGKSTVKKAKLTLTVGDVSTVYGTGFDKTKYTYTISGNANGDTDEILKNNQISVNYTNTGEKADANNDKVKTQDVGDWKLIGDFTVAGDTANNYDVTYVNGTSTVTPAEIHLKLNDVSTTYGTAFTDTNTYGYDVSQLKMANGDSTDVVTKAIGNGDITYTNTGDATDPDKIAKGAKTQDAGTGYQLTGTTEKTLQNYKVIIDGADATVDKADLTLTLKDVSTTYGNEFDGKTYGYKKDAADLQGLTNGDAATAITDVLKDNDFTYVNGGAKSDPNNENVKTQDAGSYQITGSTSKTLDNYNIKVVNPGNSTVSKKAITVENEMNQIYGEKDSMTFSEIVLPDLANGDKLDISKGSKFTISLSEDPNTPYNQNRKNRDTADVGEYADSLKYSGGGIVHNDETDAYKNYDVTIKGIAKVHPKDIYTKVIGKGSTLKDLTWTIKRDPKDQMVNGDSVEFTYTPGNLISYDNQTFDVNSFINGTQIYDSTTDVPRYGKNYIFHSKGIVQLTFNPIVKPDVWAHSGGYRPRNKIETSLPVFRVEDAKVGQYGTYGVEHNEEGDKLVLSATGMRLPEPDQVPDEERTFTTTLSTETGSGTFKLVYNGVSLKVYPQDKEAEETVRAGDKTKNVSLSEKALYVGYTEMGLDLIDLKGVYIYFN